jgi:hypothetical protein
MNSRAKVEQWICSVYANFVTVVIAKFLLAFSKQPR